MSRYRLHTTHAAVTRIMRRQGLAAAGPSTAAPPLIGRDELPLATCYIDEEARVVVVGLRAAAASAPLAARHRHVRLLAQIAAGTPVRLTYVRVVRDVAAAPPGSGPGDARPLIGGVAMQGDGTMNVVLRRRSGALQAIASSHVVGPGTGQQVGRAATSAPYGDVILNPPLGDRRSDSALISITDRRVDAAPYRIWRPSDRGFFIEKFAGSVETPARTVIWLQGATAEAIRSGDILRRGVTVADSRGTLTNQVCASYAAQGGDSGAPVFTRGFELGGVTYLGIHVGRIIEDEQEIAFYSPWEGVRDDLDLDLDM